MIDRVAARLGRSLMEVPVGFKWFTDGLLAGTLGYLAGSALAALLGAHIFPSNGPVTAHTLFNPVLLPVVVGLALLVALAGSTPSIRSALHQDPSTVLRASA